MKKRCVIKKLQIFVVAAVVCGAALASPAMTIAAPDAVAEDDEVYGDDQQAGDTEEVYGDDQQAGDTEEVYGDNETESGGDGVTEADIEEAREKAEGLDSEIKVKEREIKKAKELLLEVEDRVNELQQSVAELDEKQRQLSESIRETDGRVRELSVRVGELREQQDEQYESMKKRIRFMYENSGQSEAMTLVTKGSMAQQLNHTTYFEAVVRYDRAKLEEYKELTEETEETEREFAEKSEELKQLYEEQELLRESLNSRIAESSAEIGALADEISEGEEKQAVMQQMYEQALAAEELLEKQKEQEDLARMEEIKRQERELAEARKKAEEERKKAEEERARAKEEARLREEESMKAEEEAKKRADEEAMRQAEEAKNRIEEEAGRREEAAASNAGASVIYVGEPGSYNLTSYNSDDVTMLASIIECEADGEPYEGKILVGEVVLNRVYSSSFPDTVGGVILQSGQFSPVTSGRFSEVLAGGPAQRNIDIARVVLSSGSHSDYLFFRRYTGEIEGCVIGAHVFY